MNDPATTKLSSKGQVVIPEEIRNRLGLKPGAQFVVLGDRDVVILKVIQTPEMWISTRSSAGHERLRSGPAGQRRTSPARFGPSESVSEGDR